MFESLVGSINCKDSQILVRQLTREVKQMQADPRRMNLNDSTVTIKIATNKTHLKHPRTGLVTTHSSIEYITSYRNGCLKILFGGFNCKEVAYTYFCTSSTKDIPTGFKERSTSKVAHLRLETRREDPWSQKIKNRTPSMFFLHKYWWNPWAVKFRDLL